MHISIRSNVSTCNYCHYRGILSNAKIKCLSVTCLRDQDWGLGGLNIYVHPPEIVIKDLPGGADGEREKYRMAWFMYLPDHCAC